VVELDPAGVAEIELDPSALAQLLEPALPGQRRGAHLVFLDESGFFLTPTVRRTWAPQGQTPVLDAWDRRDRISAISSITVSPKSRRLNLYFDLLADNCNVRADDVVDYLRQLRATLGGPLTVLWDGSRVHDRAKPPKKPSRGNYSLSLRREHAS